VELAASKFAGNRTRAVTYAVERATAAPELEAAMGAAADSVAGLAETLELLSASARAGSVTAQRELLALHERSRWGRVTMEADPVRRMFARGGRLKLAKDPPELTFIDALALRARPHLCAERGWTLEEVEQFIAERLARPPDAA
jgi:hypothetical protein